jgi:hypothetical protein
MGWTTREKVGKYDRLPRQCTLSGAKSLIVSDVQPSLRTGIAPIVALLAVMSPVLARAADEITEKTTEKTTVILVDRTPKPPWETPAWAYPDRGLTFFPEGPGKGKDRWAVGGLWQIAPMFTASYMRGLGAGFSVDARLQTIILYNQFGVGGQWATMVGPFSLGVMAHVNGFFGALGKAVVATTSFDTTGWGILLDPGAKAGIQVAKDSWLTLQYEAYLSLYQSTKLGTLTISDGAASYSGFGLTALVEYAPNKQAGVIYYGVSLYNTAANYPIFFNVETSGSSEAISSQKIWYIGLLAGYEF